MKLIEIDYLIHGDYLITADDPFVIDNGAVAVAGSKIIDRGRFDEMSVKYRAKRVIGGHGKVVMPGLINTHTHAAMVFMRGIADDMPLKVWLEEHIWPAETKYLSPEFVNDATELACLEMLKAGITTFADMYFFAEASAVAAKKMGMRAVLGAGIVDFPTKTGNGPDDYLKKAESFIKDWKDDELISPAVAPHSAYACSPDTLKKSFALAQKYDTLLHTHLSETKWEVGEIQTRYGNTPVKHFDSLGILNKRFLSAHCVHLTDEEIELLTKRDASVSHCIESNLKLTSGIAPVTKMLKSGVRVTFGTDGAASNNDLNILSEMSTAAKIHKAVSEDPTALDAKTVLKMATSQAGDALGHPIGRIEAGMCADIIVADVNKPHLTPIYDVSSHVIYCMRPSDIEFVMVGGKALVEYGRLSAGNEEEILDKARHWARKLKGKV